MNQNNVFVKKWNGGGVAPVPSATNYDFILFAKSGDDDNRIQLGSVAAYVGVASAGTTTIAVMENVKVAI